ncbi:MAG: carboxypeptidase-like regulatory domain-containing protein, partial [Candidatus Hydrogenedentes bacterium]|nr:carboxypeptidase-like regulatory domain-containing protein [Candidatus Hydrogenedentota bacterium]
MTAGLTRISVIGAVLGVVATLILLALILGRGGEAPSTEQAESREAPVEGVTAPAPSADEEARDTIAREDEAAPSLPEPPPEETVAGLTGPGRIYGTVVMPGAAAVPEDMRVALHRYDSKSLEISYDDTLLETVAPGSEGAFDFKSLPLGSYVLFATSSGHTAYSLATLTRMRTERELTMSVVPGGAISGRVIDETGESVEGAHVFTAAWDIGGQERNAPRGRALASRVSTDAEGAFVMGNLHIGKSGERGYRLAVKAEGYATYVSDFMAAGTRDVELVLTLGGMVVGQLIRAGTGEPVPDMTITLDSDLAMENLSTFSDAEGWFFMTGVPPGSHRARLVDEELIVVPETAHIEVVEGEQTVDVLIVVAMGGRITGRVYDGETGAGIAGVKLHARPEGFSLPATPSTDTDAQGRYEM